MSNNSPNTPKDTEANLHAGVKRYGVIRRRTSETNVVVAIGLDGNLPEIGETSGGKSISTGIGFFDHMLDQVQKHSKFAMFINVDGDLDIDMHHSVEDCGIAMGQAFRKALADCAGIQRFANVEVPMDEALGKIAVDISGRGFLVWNVTLPSENIGNFDCQLFEEWFRAFAANAKITLHVSVPYGRNSHHMIEACFKALGRALRLATLRDQYADVPSTKGSLTT